MQAQPSGATEVADAVARYADRGFIRQVRRLPGAEEAYALRWYYGREFKLVVGRGASTLRIDNVLPGAAQEPAMLQAYNRFVAELSSTTRPEHRRIGSATAMITCHLRGQDASLEIAARNGDYVAALRHLILAVQEVFTAFLPDGPYYEYQLAAFDLDPDAYGRA
jgi:hypothetical protein